MLRIEHEYQRIARECVEIAEAYAKMIINTSWGHSMPSETDYSKGGRAYADQIAKAIRAKFRAKHD